MVWIYSGCFGVILWESHSRSLIGGSLQSCFTTFCILNSDLYFWNLDPQCHAAWEDREGIQSTKPLPNVHVYWTALNAPPLTVTLYPMISQWWKQNTVWVFDSLSITRAAGLLDKDYNSLKLRCWNFLIISLTVSIPPLQ